MTNRVWNFSPGPAALPEPVLQRAQQELLDYDGTGMSVMEMSHRGATFMAIAAKAEADLRALLGVPAHYKVLFLQGGAQARNAMVPLNLLPEAPGAAGAFWDVQPEAARARQASTTQGARIARRTPSRTQVGRAAGSRPRGGETVQLWHHRVGRRRPRGLGGRG